MTSGYRWISRLATTVACTLHLINSGALTAVKVPCGAMGTLRDCNFTEYGLAWKSVLLAVRSCCASDPAIRQRRKQAGGNTGKNFTEG